MECELLTRADAVSNMHGKTSENVEQILSLTAILLPKSGSVNTDAHKSLT
jgi:hypothetical protein